MRLRSSRCHLNEIEFQFHNARGMDDRDVISVTLSCAPTHSFTLGRACFSVIPERNNTNYEIVLQASTFLKWKCSVLVNGSCNCGFPLCFYGHFPLWAAPRLAKLFTTEGTKVHEGSHYPKSNPNRARSFPACIDLLSLHKEQSWLSWYERGFRWSRICWTNLTNRLRGGATGTARKRSAI